MTSVKQINEESSHFHCCRNQGYFSKNDSSFPKGMKFSYCSQSNKMKAPGKPLIIRWMVHFWKQQLKQVTDLCFYVFLLEYKQFCLLWSWSYPQHLEQSTEHRALAHRFWTSTAEQDDNYAFWHRTHFDIIVFFFSRMLK